MKELIDRLNEVRGNIFNSDRYAGISDDQPEHDDMQTVLEAIAALESAEAEKAVLLAKGEAAFDAGFGKGQAVERVFHNSTRKLLHNSELENQELRAEVERLRGMVPVWVPVSERFPAREEVLCVDKYGHKHLAFHKPERMNAPYQWDCDTYDVDDPTHWMPLPEAPHD